MLSHRLSRLALLILVAGLVSAPGGATPARQKAGNVKPAPVTAPAPVSVPDSTPAPAPVAAPVVAAPVSRIPHVAILELKSTSPQVSWGDLQALGSRLETEFQKTQAFQMLERRNMDAILREQGFQQSGACNTADCQVQVGQLLGVERIVVGEVSKVGKIYTLNLKMIDVGTGANVKSHALDIKGEMGDLLRGGAWEMAQIFSDRKKPTSDHSVLRTDKGVVWPWIAGGVVVIAGAAVAIVYLLNQDESAPVAREPINSVNQ